MTKKIVFLISGRGSNMQAIVEACESENWNAKTTAVISNNPDAAGLCWAEQKGIETLALDHRQYTSREAFDTELANSLETYQPDLIILAGFMRILTSEFVAKFEGRIVNIHPSLLPLFPGLHTHRRAIEAGHKKAGVTIHLVTAELDGGPILGQAEVPILEGDTEETLAARVLVEEHQLYPAVIRELINKMSTGSR